MSMAQNGSIRDASFRRDVMNALRLKKGVFDHPPMIRGIGRFMVMNWSMSLTAQP